MSLPTFKNIFFLKAIALLLWIVGATSAYAQPCTNIAGGGVIGHGGFINGNNTLTVTNQTPIGSVIWQGSGLVQLDCRNIDISKVLFWINGPLVSGYSDVFPVHEIQGVGLRVRFNSFNDGQGGQTPSTITDFTEFSYQSPGTGYPRGPYVRANMTVELLKIAPQVGTGQLDQNSSTKGFYLGYTTPSDNTPVTFHWHFSDVNITPRAVCTITTPNSMLIQMNKVDARAVKNSMAPSVDFSVGFNCSSSTRINVTINDANSNVSSNALSLTPSLRGARGVAIELRDSQDRPITLNQPWTANPFANGTFTIPFKARYIKTDELVIAGQANAIATLTFDFL